MRGAAFLLASLTTALLLASGWALAASPEDLDPSFDGDGRVITNFSSPVEPGAEGAYDVIVQPDGKIVAGGFARDAGSDDFALARYNPDGSLDDSFDEDGKLTTDIAGSDDRVVALGTQSDGKIVAVGSSGLVRYNADGSLDDSLDGDGKLTLYGTDVGNDTWVEDLAILPDDKFVVASNENWTFLLRRYNPDGSLDTSFGDDGKVTGTDFITAYDLAIQADGKILVVGDEDDDGYDDTGVVRYNPDGSLDESFDRNVRISQNDDYATSVAVQSDGKIVVAGYAADYDSSGLVSGAALTRFKANGSLDASFGSYFGGTVINSSTDLYTDQAIQEDGKIVALNAVGHWRQGQQWGVTRHNPDGSVDPSLRFKSGWGQDEFPEANAMAIQEDGKVVLAGGLLDAEDLPIDFRLSRHLGASFRDDTKPTGSVTIDGGRASTRDRSVKLTLEARDPGPESSGVSRMRIKNAGGGWTKWSPYAKRTTWRLTTGAGTKTVFVQYRDLMGNISVTAADSIRYRP